MKKSLALILALILALGLCGCGSSSGKTTEAISYDNSAPEPEEVAAAESFSAAGGLASESGSGASALPEADPDKIIYSGEATVETKDFDKSVEALLAMVEQLGGWVESSSMNGANYWAIDRGRDQERYASYTLRIPSADFTRMMEELSTIGNVPYTYVYTQNVTTQYYDTQARLEVYQAQEQRLIELLDMAQTVEDVITVEEQLAQVRYEIESLQTSLNSWDRQVSYSTLYLELQEVLEYTPQEQSYGQRLLSALTGAFQDLGDFFQDLLVFLVSSIPTILVLAALFFILRPLARRIKARRKARRQEKEEEK